MKLTGKEKISFHTNSCACQLVFKVIKGYTAKVEAEVIYPVVHWPLGTLALNIGFLPKEIRGRVQALCT